MCNTYTGAANESASQIIYKVAQACGINPQVIITTLQKEQALVTRTSTTASNWRSAMGYGCPDTAACDAQYYGFYNQVYKAAWQFKRYGNPPGTSQFFTWIPVGGYANILYNPNANCGSSRVYIANKATAALYYYTPYQPNAAALAAGYGAANNTCSSYGNRNFFFYFTDWFGSAGSAGSNAIDAAYALSGGASGPLGAAQTGYVSIATAGGGMVQAFANGAIAWTAQFGAIILSGDIRTKYNALGGIGGSLGWPTTSQLAISANGGGTVQGFQNGAVTASPTAGAHFVTGAIRDSFNASGGIAGPLGWPTTDPSCATGGSCTQDFQSGTLSGTPSQIIISSKNITTAYDAAGGATGSLGAPVTGVLVQNVNGGGLVRVFEKGAIVSSPTGGTHVLSGAIRTQFNAVGGLAGYLGWPTGDVSCDSSASCSQTFSGGTVYSSSAGTSAIAASIVSLYSSLGGAQGILGPSAGSTIPFAVNGGGFVQGFANGAITSTSASGATQLTGAIRQAYAGLGGVAGAFGWPVTGPRDIADNGGGTVQAFQNGAIAYTASAGAFPLSSLIRVEYNDVGGASGTLGWPVTGPIAVGGGLVQGFQNGAIVSKASVGTHSVSGPIRTAYATTGGLGGTIGWPTSDPTTIATNGGGTAQGFENGAITWTSRSGAALLTGPIRTFYNANGGVTGSLGWPTGSAVCQPDNSCSQSFDGGTILYSPTLGARLG
jgi:uncharacterized protein with LGFP repeats